MKNKLNVIPMIAGIGTLVGFIATGCGTVRAGYESAPRKVVRASGKTDRDSGLDPIEPMKTRRSLAATHQVGDSLHDETTR